ELKLLRALVEAGIEEPELNVRVVVAGESFELDMFWRRRRFVVEVDGGGHSRAWNREHDAYRDRCMRSDGIGFVRVAARDVHQHVDSVVLRVWSAMSQHRQGVA